MNIIGINEAACATACVMTDGNIAACISEERLSRVKNQVGFPAKAVQECLRVAGLTAPDIDLVVLSSTQSPPAIPTAHGYYTWATETGQKNWFNALVWMRNRIKFWKSLDYWVTRAFGPLVGAYTRRQRARVAAQVTGVAPQKIAFVDHHLAHAMGAIYGSGWADQDLLVLTVDGEGDMISATVGTWQKGGYQRLSASRFTDSVGGYYAAVTGLLGMKRHEHEYKVMGLAPYAGGPEVEPIAGFFAREIDFEPASMTFRTRTHAHRMEERFARFLRRKRFDHIAGAAQLHLERIMCRLVTTAVARTGQHRIVASGGVFMNVKANQVIAKLSGVEKFFVMPSSGDESLAVGACYYGHQQLARTRPASFAVLYWGNRPDETEVRKKAEPQGFRVEQPDDMAGRVAELLAAGEIVARCAGRMEFGARALGNRSILADPTAPAVVERINRAIKHRDFWMPFAPVILAEKVRDFIADHALTVKVNPAFMMYAFDTTPAGVQNLAGALHPYDKTIRPQVLRREQNPEYYDIIHKFGERTGRFALLNTSFNIHGYPIVCTTEDALQVLRDSGLEHLVLGSYLIHKKKA